MVSSEHITEMLTVCAEIAAGTDTTTPPTFVLTQAARMIRGLATELDAANATLEAVRAACTEPTKKVRKPANPLGCGLKVYLVEDTENAPGRVMAVMADEDEANWFADQLPGSAKVRPRKLWYGQPTNRGYNE
jgi:hypothetical protein